jgi:hypothetical protein
MKKIDFMVKYYIVSSKQVVPNDLVDTSLSKICLLLD